jgi:hypothetical protein
MRPDDAPRQEQILTGIVADQSEEVPMFSLSRPFAAGLAGLVALGLAGPAQAMPVAPQLPGGDAQVIQVQSNGYIIRRGGGGGARVAPTPMVRSAPNRAFAAPSRSYARDAGRVYVRPNVSRSARTVVRTPNRAFVGRTVYPNRGYVYRGNGYRRYANNPWYGHRYHYRRPGYAYHHGGWWYSSPWWDAGAGVAVGALVGSAVATANSPLYDSHVSWCLNRYRTYDPRTDTFRGNDGLRHRCVGP